MRWLALLLFPAISWAQPTCWPVLDNFTFKVGKACYAYGWTCLDKRVIVAGPFAAFTGRWREQGLALATGTNEERIAAWKQYVTLPSIPEACSDAANAVRAQLTPVETWAVAPTSVGTRPTYPWANGVRSTVAAAERVASGAPCDPAVGAGNYRGVLGRSDRVALCAKQ